MPWPSHDKTLVEVLTADAAGAETNSAVDSVVDYLHALSCVDPVVAGVWTPFCYPS